MGLRGRVITVFDLGVVLGRGSVLQRGLDHRILVLDHHERVVGLAVDAIAEIARNEAALLSAPPEKGVSEAVRDAVVGVGVLGDRQYLALNPDSILSRLLA
jgi:chemotaxis signal transduction protein